MAINQPILDALDTTTISDAEQYLADYIAGVYPDLDLNPSSVLFQLLIKPAAIYYTLNKQYIENAVGSNSLNQIEADPTIADDSAVDNVLSNYLITRATGLKASGQIRLILTASKYTPITTNVEFVANGVTYKPTRAYEGVTSSDQIVTGNEELIVALNTKFSFTIDVEATTAGIAGNIKKGSTFTSTLNNANVEQVIATEDFDNGKDDETNAELIDRLKLGISTANMGSRISIEALVKNNFPYTTDVSVIGANDPEMLRDQHNALGISSFGKADIYTRTRSVPVETQITKDATLQSTNTWSVTFTRDECPAAYRITSINNTNDVEGTTSLDLVSTLRVKDISDISGLDIYPEMTNAEFAFTRYQSLVIVFSGDSEGYEVGDTKEFDFTYLAMPQIADINDYVLSRSVRHPCSDCLVKAPIPCLVGLSLTIVKGIGEVDPDIDVIKTALCSYINGVDFQTGVVSTDAILSVVKKYIGRRSRVRLPLDLRGEVILPITYSENNDSYWIFDNHELKLPAINGYMLSNRTVSFFGLVRNIEINIERSDKLPV